MSAVIAPMNEQGILTPLKKYKADIRDRKLTTDPAQEKVVAALQDLFERLLQRERQQNRPLYIFKSLLGLNERLLTGLYCWGGVGRGKTWLVDCFYECLPFNNKQRIHFHRFMQEVHKALKQLDNIENPLQVVADRLATDTWVLCFDEFHVGDITDAMLLSGLLEALFERGVVLVTTSNQHPDELYRDGLQRERFLPAIALLKKYTRVLQIDTGVDYRLQFLDNAEVYHSPLDEEAQTVLKNNYGYICPDTGVNNKVIEIVGRSIQTVCCGDGVVWFDFMALCDGPRGAADYIEIARQFQTVLLANIPIMDERHDDITKRFIILVDEFYDRNVKLIITAEAEPEALYTGSRLKESFVRTVSRLKEMQTHDYLAKQHLP